MSSLNNRISEKEFEKIIIDSFSEIPPEDIANAVTPWRKSMNRILTGLCLTSVTFNFLALNYIMPAIGFILMLLGFRGLRKENKAFFACYILMIVRSLYLFPILILNSTIYAADFSSSAANSILSVINLLLVIATLIFFCIGLNTVKRKTDIEKSIAASVWLVIWYVVIAALSVIGTVNYALMILLIVAYICIIVNLYKLSKGLDEIGYSITPCANKISDRALVCAVASVLAIGIACGYFFFSSYKMDWQPIEENEHSQVEEIKAELLELGFPKYVLDDLSADDIAACEGADLVIYDTDTHPTNQGYSVTERTDEGLYTYTKYDVEELQITGVAVRLSGERERWLIFQHFYWTHDPGFYGTEALQLWPAYRNYQGWAPDTDLSGRVLYNNNGTTYSSPYHSIGSETYSHNTMFWGEQTSTDIFATFSMPKRGSDWRGYVSYGIKQMEEGWIVDAWINYCHQSTFLQYPAKSAAQHRKHGNMFDDSVFITVQDALQFYPTDEEVEILN